MSRPLVAAFDLLAALLLVFVVLALTSAKPARPAVDTLGVYAVTVRWEAGNDDIDLYVRDPHGRVVYFGAQSVGVLQLEYDDLGSVVTSGVGTRGERVVVRGVAPGEYVVNVHAYRMETDRPVRVTVTLWRLAGDDERLRETVVILEATADEQTAFRFVIRPDGSAGGYSELQTRFVGEYVS